VSTCLVTRSAWYASMSSVHDDWWETLARLIAHPVRLHLLYKYAEGATSPSAIAKESGTPLNVVSYHTQVLLRAGCIELVRTERRRGARERFYRAVLGSEIDDAAWSRLPVKLRRALARLIMDTSWREAGDALPHGGMDAGTAHVSRTLLSLDERGREELAELLVDTAARAREIGNRARSTGTAPHQLVIFSFERASRP
jgi:DNA-binding transcriptional ArsR family regulator